LLEEGKLKSQQFEKQGNRFLSDKASHSRWLNKEMNQVYTHTTHMEMSGIQFEK